MNRHFTEEGDRNSSETNAYSFNFMHIKRNAENYNEISFFHLPG